MAEQILEWFGEYEAWCKKYGLYPAYSNFKKWVETEKATESN